MTCTPPARVHAFVAACLLVAVAPPARAQQVPDTGFEPRIERPAFATGAGPVVAIDEAHHNFHTATGRYLPFANLLRRDGFVVRPSTQAFTAEALRGVRILVVSNALSAKNADDWAPPHPSAFADAEISAVRDWIATGGSLLLIADHAPFAGAAGQLGKALGVTFLDGYALGTGGGVLMFRRADASLAEHALTRGIDEVASFTGSSFQLQAPGEPLLVLGKDVVSRPSLDAADATPVAGHLQGAVLTLGKGRVAVFGEAAMFSAQLAGPNKVPIGMNAPVARQNAHFLLNVLHWLAGTP